MRQAPPSNELVEQTAEPAGRIAVRGTGTVAVIGPAGLPLSKHLGDKSCTQGRSVPIWGTFRAGLERFPRCPALPIILRRGILLPALSS